MNEAMRPAGDDLSLGDTERRAHGQEVARAADDLRNLLASTDSGTLFLDRALRVPRYTPAAGTLLDLSPTDAGRPLDVLTRRLDTEELPRDAARALETLAPVVREVSIRHGGGDAAATAAERRHFLARLAPYRTADARVDGVVLTFLDITERHRVEEELRLATRHFETVARVTNDAIWDWDLRTDRLTWSDGAQRLFGYASENITTTIGWWAEQIHPEDRETVCRGIYAAINAGETAWSAEYRFRRADGTFAHVSDRGHVSHDAAGRPVRMLGGMTDITARERAERALRESEERFRLLVEGARDYAMFLLDRDNRITFWSAGAERVFGWSEVQVMGQKADFIFTPEDRDRGAPEQESRTACAAGRAADRRWHVRADGTRFWADGVLMRLDEERGGLKGFVKVARDATEQYQAEAALREAHDQL